MSAPSFDLAALADFYAAGGDPGFVAAEAWRRAGAQSGANAWILLREEADILADAAALARRDRAALPLYGVPFAVKDNIDVAGLPTTAACPEFAYLPAESAAAVTALREAGAILIGKTNLDQFATGLVGTRSPYGACRNPFDPAYVSGGSSSGSAVAVAGGAVAFALGTDTAGSGRVPAAFCNIVGWKGTRGLVSARGVVPACRSLDCVTVFALTCADAARIAAVLSRFDADDPWSRPAPAATPDLPEPPALRVGVPRADQLAFFGNPHAPGLFAEAVERFRALGARLVEVDLAPFLAAARLLYEGPWVAERTAAVGGFLAENPGVGDPVVRGIVEGGRHFNAVDTFRARYELQALTRRAERTWETVDVVLTPTAGTIHRIADVAADPVRLNAQLGYYTNFMNLLDLSAVAIPSGFQPDGLPFGVTLFAPAFHDDALLNLGGFAHAATGLPMGATGRPLSASDAPRDTTPASADAHIELAVFGAHMQGLPLSGQLTGRGGRPIGPIETAPAYRLYALERLNPPRPGLLRTGSGGAAIAGELWSLPAAAMGAFLSDIAAPLCIGRVELADGRWVAGFLCEVHAVAGGARDITALGGWRRWLAERDAPASPGLLTRPTAPPSHALGFAARPATVGIPGRRRCGMEIIRAAARPTRSAPADRFTGQVWQDEVIVGHPPARMRATLVSFAPGARTAWHSHPLGQVLWVVSGIGRVQMQGGPVHTIQPGDTVRIPPDIRHWHGAAPDRIFAHLAMSEVERGSGGTEWFEKVSDEDYGGAQAQ
ncbi:MAG: allophanate hydrolase [Alphaproteobacteria bacterium]